MPTQNEAAAEVRAAVKALNTAISAARKAGLSVEISEVKNRVKVESITTRL
jgi:hypothetical protein